MKTSNSDSSVALFSECPSKEEKSRSRDHVYSGEFKAMLDSLEQEECGGERSTGLRMEKKRRLDSNQVKALEKYFELENKLEPERKTKLAEELGLQPRQVAIWFQNRRARWKAKQLERDYDLLKASYDTLKLEYDNLEHDKENLIVQVRELKKKLHLETEDSDNHSISMEESPLSGSVNNTSTKSKTRSHDMNENDYCNTAVNESYQDTPVGSTHDNDNNGNLKKKLSNVNGDETRQLLLTMPAPLSSCHDYNSYCCSSSTTMPPMLNWFHIASPIQQPPLSIRAEERQQSLMVEEDSCNFFSVDQAPSIMNCSFPEQEQ